MAVQEKEITVADRVYSFKHFSAYEGIPLLSRITTYVHNTLAATITDETSEIVAALLADFASPEVEDIFKQLTKSATYNGQPVDFDTEFSGEFDHLLKFIIAAIDFNFGSILFKTRYTKPLPLAAVNEDGSAQALNPKLAKVDKEFSQDFVIYQIVMAEKHLASMYELQTIYNTQDAYNFLEMINVHATFTEEAAKASV